ncbi:hypothetical protein PMAYCL1PPCAC_01999, partial [Pristionchus mayeri]
MFADESNAKCETFVSRSPSRGAAAIDAFSSPHLWRSTLLWCVPPPYLLCQTLAWLRGNRAKAILGLPYWTSHPIFPSLFPPNYTPPFVKDYLMFAEGMHVINPIEGARAPNTIRAYKGCMKKLLDFAKERRIDPLCPESLLIFSLRRLEEGRSLSSFKILSSSISFFSDPVSPFVSHMLSLFADFARRCSLVSHHKNIPVSHVHALVHCASLSPRDTNRLRAGLGTALSFGALDDLTWSKSLLKISIRKAKNDQASEGRETFLSIEEDSESLSLYDAYTQQVPRSEWVFPSLSHPSAHISTDQFRKDLYSLCEVAGIERVTPHQL